VSVKPIIIDCYGHATATSLDVECSVATVQFLFSDRKLPGLNAHFGLYVDYTATAGPDYLRYPKSRRMALLCEPNSSFPFVDQPALANRFCLIFTHDSRLLSRGAPFLEMPFGTSFIEAVLDEPPEFAKRRLVSMIGAPHPNPQAGHILRNEVILALSKRNDVDRFGKDVRWIDYKLEGLADYAFSIAMENCCRDYYFSEKIIDCLITETVPIYYGCPGIGRFFDLRGMLVFETLPELQTILDELTWERYTEMLQYARANRDRAIAEGWATRKQLFERVATAVRAECGNVSTIARSTLFRKAQDGARVLRQRFSKRQDENS